MMCQRYRVDYSVSELFWYTRFIFTKNAKGSNTARLQKLILVLGENVFATDRLVILFKICGVKIS